MLEGWRSAIVVWLALVLGLIDGVNARCLLWACCPAWRFDSPVRIADQRILIVWDPVTKTEHFIRSAGFRGPEKPSPKGDDAGTEEAFGFLVPSPTQPEVAEADESVFAALDHAVRPRIEIVDRWRSDPTPLVLKPFLLSSKLARMPPGASIEAETGVRVLERKQVGHYDVAVLQASDATALTEWLSANGFDSRPALTEWAEPYVAKDWIITAFRYVAGSRRVDTGAVRMSFQTDQPLFAYRVPVDNLAKSDDPDSPPSLLRSYVVLPGRATGRLGEGERAVGWQQARCRYARPIAGDAVGEALGRCLPKGAAIPAAAWLTAFDDPTWPSGTEDLWFSADPDAEEHQEVRRRYRDRTIPLPLDVIGLGLIAAAWGIRRRFA
jgi:hypothetical protein